MLRKVKNGAIALAAVAMLLACAVFAAAVPSRVSAHEDFTAIGDYVDSSYILFEKKNGTNINRGFQADGFSAEFELDDSAGSGDRWAALSFTEVASTASTFAANIAMEDGFSFQVVAVNGFLRFMPWKETNKITLSKIPATSRFTVSISGDEFTISAAGVAESVKFDISSYGYKSNGGRTYCSVWIYSAVQNASPSRIKMYGAAEGKVTYSPKQLAEFGSSVGTMNTAFSEARATFTNANAGIDLGLKASEGVSVTLGGSSSNASESGDWYSLVFASQAKHGSFGSGLSGFRIRFGEAAGWYKFFIASGSEPGGDEYVYFAGPESIPEANLQKNDDGLVLKYAAKLKVELAPRGDSFDLRINGVTLTRGGASLFDSLSLGESGFVNDDGDTFLNFGAYYNASKGGRTTVNVYEASEGNTLYGVEEIMEQTWTTSVPQFLCVENAMTFYAHGEYKHPLDAANFEIKMSVGNDNGGDVYKIIGFMNKGGAPEYGTIANPNAGIMFLVRYDGASKQIYFCAYKMPGIVELTDGNSDKIQLRYGIKPGQPFTIGINYESGKYVLRINGNEAADAEGNSLLETYFADNDFLDSDGKTHFVVGSHNNILDLPVNVFSVRAISGVDLRALKTRDGKPLAGYTAEAYTAADVKIDDSEFTLENGIITFGDANVFQTVKYVVIKADGYEDLKYTVGSGSKNLVLELPKYTATVTLKDRSGNPVTDAAVKSVSEYYASAEASASGGTYTLENVRGEISFEIQKDGYIYTGSHTADAEHGAAEIVLDKLYTASLTLEDADGAAVTHAVAYATLGGKQVAFAKGENGAYTLEGAYGSISAVISAVGYESQGNVTFDEENTARQIALTATDYEGSVYVFDENYDAITGATITVTGASGASVTVTDLKNGEYTVTLSEKEYTVSAAYGEYTFTGKLSRENSEIVFVAEKKKDDGNNGGDNNGGDNNGGDNNGGDNNGGNGNKDDNKDDDNNGGGSQAPEENGGCGSSADGAFALGALILLGLACMATVIRKRVCGKEGKNK